jgi:hypothetical protein
MDWVAGKILQMGRDKKGQDTRRGNARCAREMRGMKQGADLFDGEDGVDRGGAGDAVRGNG